MGKPQKNLLTARNAKIDKIHPSDESVLVSHVALFNILCGASAGSGNRQAV
jgi:hypothetical protein